MFGANILRFLFFLSFAALNSVAFSQVSVDLSSYGIKINKGDNMGSNVVENAAGVIDSSVQMQGVAVINGEVFVDGDKVPKGQKIYKSPKSGAVYEIKWGNNGNVSVRQK